MGNPVRATPQIEGMGLSIQQGYPSFGLGFRQCRGDPIEEIILSSLQTLRGPPHSRDYNFRNANVLILCMGHPHERATPAQGLPSTFAVGYPCSGIIERTSNSPPRD